MSVMIEDIVSGKGDNEKVNVEGLTLPVKALKDLIKEGYVQLRVYKDNNTVSVWGKTCTACFSEKQLSGMT